MSFVNINNLEMKWDSLSINFTCTVKEGEMLVITGHSGSGKSTVLRMIAGLLPAGNKAEITVDNINVTNIQPGKRGIGMVFQNAALFPHLNVLDNAAYGLRSAGWSKKESRIEAQLWLHKFGLDGFENRLPSSLSGGEAQRVSLVRTLIIEPRLVLFDEPFSALDSPLRKKLGADLRERQKELGFAGIMVTHDIAEAKTLGDAVIVIKNGQISWKGNPSEFSEDFI